MTKPPSGSNPVLIATPIQNPPPRCQRLAAVLALVCSIAGSLRADEPLHGKIDALIAQAHPEDVSRILIVDTLPFYALVFNPSATVELMIPQAKAIGDSMLAIPDDQFAAMQPQFTAAMVKSPEGAKAVANYANLDTPEFEDFG